LGVKERKQEGSGRSRML